MSGARGEFTIHFLLYNFLLVKFFLKIALLVVLVPFCIHAEPIASLHPTNYVNDFAGVLDASTEARLNNICKQIDEKAHAQISVAIVKTLDGQDVFNYGVALYQAWGIGPKSSNRGVLILLATQDHKYWTTVGYGLEPILPDGKVGGFGREAIPLLRNGDYNGAVTLLTSRVASVIAQDAGVTLEGAPPPPRYAPRSRGSDGPGAIVGLIVVVIFVLVVSSMIRRGGPRGGGGFWSGLLWGILLDSMRSGRGYGGGGGWGGGGFGGFGGGGGGGGFGGFGGGSTGGGGAGGSW